MIQLLVHCVCVSFVEESRCVMLNICFKCILSSMPLGSSRSFHCNTGLWFLFNGMAKVNFKG